MKQKYYQGDVVRLINLSTDQIRRIHYQTCREPVVQNIIGQMYYIDEYIDFAKGYTLAGWNHGGHCMYFTELQLVPVMSAPRQTFFTRLKKRIVKLFNNL